MKKVNKKKVKQEWMERSTDFVKKYYTLVPCFNDRD